MLPDAIQGLPRSTAQGGLCSAPGLGVAPRQLVWGDVNPSWMCSLGGHMRVLEALVLGVEMGTGRGAEQAVGQGQVWGWERRLSQIDQKCLPCPPSLRLQGGELFGDKEIPLGSTTPELEQGLLLSRALFLNFSTKSPPCLPSPQHPSWSPCF